MESVRPRTPILTNYRMITNIIVYNRPSLNVEYDYVGIIDGLSDVERQDFAITQDQMDILSSAGVQPVVARVDNRLALLLALEYFFKQALDGKKFMLHFVAHGNDEGIFAATEFCDWTTLPTVSGKLSTRFDPSTRGLTDDHENDL